MSELNKYYSQFGQDKFIIENIFKMKKNGFFIEAGAGDGINISNTYVLEKQYNWNGLCVEPNLELYEKLINNRKCYTTNELLYSKDNLELDFTNYKLLGGIETDLREKIKKKNIKTEKKKTVTLNKILEKINAPNIIDYFSLDTEGSEYEILKGIDFNKYTINYLSVEINKDNEKYNLIKELLEKNNYTIFRKHRVDIDFIHKNFLESIL